MSKPLPYIIGTLALIFLVVGFRKSYADSIIYSKANPPTYDFNLYVKSSDDSLEGIHLTNFNAQYAKQSSDMSFIVYLAGFDGSKLYKKSASDSSTGSLLLNMYTSYPFIISPDSKYLIYTAGFDGNKLYKKSVLDTGSGSAITDIAGYYPTFTSAGDFIIYQGASSHLQMKSYSDTSSGSVINSASSLYPAVSPDGQYVIYQNNSDGGKIYRKSILDTSNGSAINSANSSFPFYSLDGNYIFYSNDSDGSKLYKKSASDSSNGSAILSFWALSPSGQFPYIAPPSTGGNGTTFSQNGLVCTTLNYPTFSSSPYSIGNGTFSDNSSGATIPDRYSFQWMSTDRSYQDRFSVYPSTGLYLDTETFTGGLSAGKTTTIYSDLDSIDNGLPTSLSVFLTRTGSTAIVNYVKIKTQNQGFSPINSNDKNVVAEVRFNGIDGMIHTYPLVYSGGYATAISRFPSKSVNIRFTTGTVTFDGFEIGYSNSGTTAKTSCKNSAFSCDYIQHIPGVFSCDSGLNVSGIPQGECEIVSNICQPKANIIPYYDGLIVPGGAIEKAINSSGAQVGLDYQEEDIFTCNETGLSTLVCPFQVIGKVWGKFTFVIKKLVNLIYGISSLGSPSGQGNIFSFLIPSAYASTPQLATPFDISGSGTSSTSYTGSDMMNLNKTILKASDNVFNMDSGGIKGIYALSMWFLILVGVVFVIVIFLIAFI